MNDLKFAFRQLLKHPGFTAVAVLTLALGIGANTAIFSVFNAVFLRPLASDRPHEIVSIISNEKSEAVEGSSSYLDFVDYQEQTRSEEHTSELQSLAYLVCRLLLEKKKREI